MTPVPLTQLIGGSFGPGSFFEMAIPLGKQWKGSKMERGERRGKMGWGGRWRKEGQVQAVHCIPDSTNVQSGFTGNWVC